MKNFKLLKTLLVLIGILIGSVSTQMWGAYYITGSNGNIGGWGTWKNMTESSDGMFWYFQAASGNCECKINTAKNYTNALDAGYRDGGFCDTDLGGNTWDSGGNINYWYNSGSYYILVYVPNTAVNTTNKAKVCASTFLPDAGYETTGNTMKYYSNKAATDQTTSALDRDNGSSTDLGTVTTLYLKGFNSKMWQHGSGNIYGESKQHYYYKVHRTAVAAGSTGFTDAKNATSWSAGTWTWGSFNGSKYRYPTYSGSLNENLLSGLGSGNYTMSYYYLQEGSKNFRHPSDGTKFNKLTWTIAVPAMGTHTCTSDGSGDGSSGTPFSVAVGEDLTITVSGTQASSDANSSLYVSFDGGDTYSSTNTYVVENITSSKLSLSIKAKYYNSADDLSGTVYDFGTIYYQGTLTPSLAISSFTQNASTVTAANSGSTVTINASRQNAGSATITYAYSTDNSNWTTIASTTNTSQSWTLPACTSTTTYYVRASMTYNSTPYSDTETITVYGKKTIKVKDTNSWGANFKIHRWGGDASGTEYPGETTNITSAGGQWKQVVLYSSSTDFILCNGSSSSTADANKTANKTYAGMTDGYCYVIQSGSGTSLTLTSTDCPSAPSVTTASASSVATTSATFNASGVNANNDAITDYGFKWGTTDACSSGTVTASNFGAGTTFSASKTGLTNGTTYYYKAYATNGFGTTYGSVVNFRTKFVTTVTLNPQGGSGGTTSVTATEGSAMPSGQTAPGKTGYTFGGYYANAGGDGKKYYNANMTSANNWDVAASTATIHAKWTPITYTIHFNGNGNTSGSMSDQTGVTYDAATTITANAFGKTGYNFAGWATTQERANAGTVDRTDGAAHGNLASTQGATAQLWAVWTPKQSAISFDYQTGVTGYSSSGSITNVDLKGTYGAAMTALTGTMPSAIEGYAFTGFYDATSDGTKYYNADGSSAHVWDKDTESGTTLYARWESAAITNIAFSPGTVVENNSTVTVTATISPTPTGTTTVCWRVLYNDTGNPLDPQPTFTPSAQGNSVSFTAPEASGMYKVEAKLHTGNACGGGTLLDTEVAAFQVAGSHTVTVAYKCSGTSIAASTSMTARPLVWSEEFTAPDIFGYTFSNWTAVDGITIKNGDSDPVTTSTNATIQIKATYNGTLTANYTPKSIIYFKNTLGWSSVYVNFYTGEGGYWDDKGSGNKSVTNRNIAMSRIGETDVWYYDYGAASITPTKWVSFTQDVQNGDGSGAQNFWASGTGEPVSYPARRADDLADKAGETGFYSATPMFVPTASQTPVTLNNSGGGKALYYNSGYWTKYLPGTGYTLQFYNNGTGAFIKEVDFTSADELMPMKAVVDLEANTTYKFQIKRHGDVYLGNSGTMTYANHGQGTPWEMTSTGFTMCRITTTAYGNYTFNFTYSSNASNEYRLRISVDYPVANGDYRLVYSDDVHTNIHPSAIVQKENNGEAIVSFFVRHDQTPVLRIQQASVDGSGNITWNEYPTIGTQTNQISGSIASAITKDTVYNFNLTMNGSGALSVASTEYYSGNYYIRTDAANSKWDNYRTDPDHLMTYSEYLKNDLGYSHYYTHWVNKDDAGRKNVKFVIANDYSPCISDTLARETATGTWANIASFIEEGGDLKRSANVRFMWDIKTNNIARAYIDGAQGPGSNFYLLLLSDDSKIKQGETTKTQVTFADNGNWIYETNIKAQPDAQIKLKSTWGEGTTIVQYFKGAADDTETLIGGSGSNWYDIRVIYDFKTNRLVAAYVPATGTYNTNDPINADVMFIREHQGDISQLTFGGSGAISKINTAYGVLRLNKWTINNKDKSTHNPLATELSRFERDLFYISFPFRVNLEEVFGFGTYGTHWIVEEYDGAGRAANGFWKDTPTFWRFITNRKGKYLEPNIGYIVAIDLDELGESSSVWTNTDQVELYFPSSGSMPDIKSSTITHNIPEHTCTINRPTPEGDRRVKDSHWNVMSVPTYINTSNVSFANTDWITTATETSVGPQFLYTVNWSNNSLTAVSGASYTYKAMHAYIVQYCGNVTWTASGSPYPSPIVARRTYEEAPKNVEFRIELGQNEQMIDQTFVRLTNDENVTSGFEFNYDMSKEFNKNEANIYTMVTSDIDGDISTTETAGNCLPMTEQTTIVPVGVQIAKAGEYTFAIPDGTNGVGVTLVDNETGARTSLSTLDYTVDLTEGTHNGRFVLEISPVAQTPTGIEEITDDGLQVTGARKVMVDGILYIVKDGKVFDSRGARVE